MTQGIEPIIAERFMTARLEDRAALMAAPVSGRIFGHAAPQAEDGEPDYPFILFTQNAVSQDVSAIGSILIWAVLEYVVRVVGRTNSWDPLLESAAEIDAALADTDGVVTPDGTIHACTRMPLVFASASTAASGSNEAGCRDKSAGRGSRSLAK